MSLTNQERWIRAMSKVPYSLIGFNGYTEEEAKLVCSFFRNDAPKKVTNARIRDLEGEIAHLSDAPLSESVVSMEALPPQEKGEKRTPSRRKRTYRERGSVPKSEDYPAPWCTVRNAGGDVIRYEDANGRVIPEVLWPRIPRNATLYRR